ncbi:MAG: hypothetical protein WCC89_18445 [Candidatus Sulfotelmatobacter sp.]
MRILLDRNVPEKVRAFLSKHEVRTISAMGWSARLKNGELLNAAEADGFDVLLTCDQNIRYQQNLSLRKLALVVLTSNLWPSVSNCGSAIQAAVENATPGSFQTTTVPLPPLPRKTNPQ